MRNLEEEEEDIFSAVVEQLLLLLHTVAISTIINAEDYINKTKLAEILPFELHTNSHTPSDLCFASLFSLVSLF